MVFCVLATTTADEAYWKLFEDLYLETTDQCPVDWVMPPKPPSAPWLAVVLLPGIATDTDAAHWLGDFERCLAWLIIERENPKQEAAQVF